MKPLYLFSISFLLSSCGVSIGYLGNRYKPTEKVEVFVDVKAIKQPYTVIGKGYEEQRVGYGGNGIENLQRKAIAKAKQVGADAVLFQDYLLPQTGTVLQSTSRTDSLPGAVVTNSNLYASPVVQMGRQILFLKWE